MFILIQICEITSKKLTIVVNLLSLMSLSRRSNAVVERGEPLVSVPRFDIKVSNLEPKVLRLLFVVLMAPPFEDD